MPSASARKPLYSRYDEIQARSFRRLDRNAKRQARPWRNRPGFLLIAAFLLPATAYGHAGHDWGADAASGLLHPATGWDHLLAMLALGAWAGRTSGRVLWLLPGLSPMARAPVRDRASAQSMR